MQRVVATIVWGLILCASAGAQSGIITTIAGSPVVYPNVTVAFNAPLGEPFGAAIDPQGNLYVADPYNSRIFELDLKGSIRTVAGNGLFGFGGDGGPATAATLNYPLRIAIDRSGNLFFTDTNNFRVRKVSSDGVISTVAGNGTAGFSGDGGPAVTAELTSPVGVAVDVSGDLFIVDEHRIREISAQGVITTVAGTGSGVFSGDGGPATSAGLNGPDAVTVDGSGNLFFTEESRVREISSQGVITTVAGGGAGSALGDGGPATAAILYGPSGVTIDGSGNIYIADTYDNRIRKVSTTGIITTVAGSGGGCDGALCENFGDGGPAAAALFSYPMDVVLDASGNLFITDSGNGRVREVSSIDIVTTLAGNGQFGFTGDGGPATSANLKPSAAALVDGAGNLLISDSGNNRVRKISPSGSITTVVGNGTQGFAGDGGPALAAELNVPRGLGLDAAGNLYIADSNNSRVRKVSPGGIITTFAGDGTRFGGSTGNGGPAASASVTFPWGIAVDGAGNVFIADQSAAVIRKVATNGIITTVAGGGGRPGLGDGGPATQALLVLPASVVVDSSGNLFIADAGDGRVRMVSAATGVITTVAGTGDSFINFGYSGDGGPAAAAALDYPEGVAVDAAGNVFIADTLNARIREVSTTGIITTVVGDGPPGYSGDGGPATSARLASPTGLSVDASGDLIIVDSGDNVIRKVWASNAPPGPVAPADGVVEAAGFSAMISGGGIGSIYGTNLAPVAASASFEPLPWYLGGDHVTLNGIMAPLLFVSPGQINFQVPWELLSSTTATLNVVTPNGTSPPITVNLSPAAPGIFNLNTPNSASQGVILIAGAVTWVAPVGAIPGVTSRPAEAGDYLTLYCSGLGAVTDNPGDGAPAGGLNLSYVQGSVSAAIGGQMAKVLFAGLAPGFFGLYQINLEVPSGIASGNAVPVIVTAAGVGSNRVTIAVQ